MPYQCIINLKAALALLDKRARDQKKLDNAAEAFADVLLMDDESSLLLGDNLNNEQYKDEVQLRCLAAVILKIRHHQGHVAEDKKIDLFRLVYLLCCCLSDDKDMVVFGVGRKSGVAVDEIYFFLIASIVLHGLNPQLNSEGLKRPLEDMALLFKDFSSLTLVESQFLVVNDNNEQCEMCPIYCWVRKGGANGVPVALNPENLTNVTQEFFQDAFRKGCENYPVDSSVAYYWVGSVDDCLLKNIQIQDCSFQAEVVRCLGANGNDFNDQSSIATGSLKGVVSLLEPKIRRLQALNRYKRLVVPVRAEAELNILSENYPGLFANLQVLLYENEDHLLDIQNCRKWQGSPDFQLPLNDGRTYQSIWAEAGEVIEGAEHEMTAIVEWDEFQSECLAVSREYECKRDNELTHFQKNFSKYAVMHVRNPR